MGGAAVITRVGVNRDVDTLLSTAPPNDAQRRAWLGA